MVNKVIIGVFTALLVQGKTLEENITMKGSTLQQNFTPMNIMNSSILNECCSTATKLDKGEDQDSIECVNTTSTVNSTDTDSTTNIDPTELKTTIQSSSSTTFPKSSNSPTLQEFDGKPGCLAEIKVEDHTDLNETDPKFLTFDEWKKVKLNEKAVSHSEGKERSNGREDTSFYKSDSIGEDMEIDFGLFTSTDNSLNDEPEGKLYKDKFNYASLDCAATIVKTNSEASDANAILHENKDKYLLNPCTAANKFIVIELCQDILVEEIAIANYEFFSSTFRNLRFSVSDRFPPKSGWKVLGEFEAVNTRNLQKFSITNPMIWARYLRVEILSHYGDEFYCPISIIRAHGKTMIDEFKLDETESKLQEEIHDTVVSVDDKSKGSNEPLGEHVDVLNGTMTDQCTFPLSLTTNNMTIVSDLENDSQCPALLPHLKFEEFLKDLNRSTDPMKLQKTLNMSTSLPSSYAEESIFKNIMKRLTLLESNATLSLLYIEEQSKLLSKSFSNLEKSQAKKFDILVDVFNQSIMSNLESLSIFAKQLRESSLKILEEQKLTNDQFTTETLLRFEAMKKDAAFQKRLMYTTLFAFTALLVYVLLTREAYIDEFMEDDGWYLNSPPLKKAKNNIIRKTNRRLSLSRALIFEASSDANEADSKSDFSFSSSSASLYDDSKSVNSFKEAGSVLLSLRKDRQDEEDGDDDEDDIDIDDIINIEALAGPPLQTCRCLTKTSIALST